MCPADDAVARPSDLLVHVQDTDGLAIAGAEVLLDGAGGHANSRGDRAFLNLPSGAVVVTARAPGHGDQVRSVTLEEGEVKRLWVTLPRAPTELVFSALDGARIEDDDYGLTLPPGSFVAPGGGPWTGMARLRWSWLRIQDEGDLALAPGPLVGVTEDRETRTLSPFAVLTVAVTTPEGLPLRLAPGASPRLSIELPEIRPAAGESQGLWTLDQAAGAWHESELVALEEPAARASEDGFELLLPDLGTFTLAEALEPACLDVSVACADPDMAPIEVRLRGGGRQEQRMLSSLDSTPRFEELPPGTVAADLVINGAVVATEEATLSAGGSCAELTLAPPACAGIGVALLTGADCPATGTRLVARRPNGAIVHDAVADNSIVWLDASEGDEWTLTTLDQDGAPFDAEIVRVGTGLSLAVLQAPPGDAETPEGGCHRPICSGGTCDACVAIEILDASSQPVEAQGISVCDPVGELVSTDEQGEVCIDVPDGAGSELQIYVPGARIASAPLPAGGSCADPGSCVMRTLYKSGPELECPGESTLVGVDMLQVGLLNPAWHLAGVFTVPYHLPPALVSLELTEDAHGIAPSDYELTCGQGAFGFVTLAQDTLGIAGTSDTLVRCRTRDGLGVGLDVDLSRVGAGGGSYPVGATGEAVGVDLLVQDPWAGTMETRAATAGQVDLIRRAGGWLSLDLDLELGEDALLAGTLTVPLVTGADTPMSVHARGARALHQGWGLLRTESGEKVFGPSGEEAVTLQPIFRPEQPSVCVPLDSPFVLQGEARPGAVAALTAVIAPGRLNDFARREDVDAPAFIPLRWVDREYLELLYARNGLDPAIIDSRGTVLGSLTPLVPEGSLAPGAAFGDVYLVGPDGERIEGRHLREDFVFTDASEGIGFAFTAVPPADLEHPYTLVVEDARGRVIPELSYEIAPVAGSVVLLYP